MASLDEDWTDDSEEEQIDEIQVVSEDDGDDELLEKPKAPPNSWTHSLRAEPIGTLVGHSERLLNRRMRKLRRNGENKRL